jgi:hypothetical protein
MKLRNAIDMRLRRVAASVLTGSFARFSAVAIDLISFAASQRAVRRAGRDKRISGDG